jgi:alkylhydroperoxidase/carboxymuconolactone decarboxylase family protein YurZ
LINNHKLIKYKKNKFSLNRFFLTTAFVQAQEPITNAKHQDLLEKNPFNILYSKNFTKASAAYFDAAMKIYSKGPIKEKEAHLAALATSAATKCECCIPFTLHKQNA